MSLVVGYASADIGFLVADTLFSYPTAVYNPREPALEQFHGLKIQILTPELAVAFSGDVESATAMVTALRRDLLLLPVPSVPERLAEIRQSLAHPSGNSPDFLVLSIAEDHSKRLAHVSDAGVSYCQRAYIGDPIEYQNLRRLWKDYEGPLYRQVQRDDGSFDEVVVSDGEREFDQASDAMERLTHQRRSTSVGAICGCVIRVVDARLSKKLEYLQSIEASLSPEEGEAGFSLLASNIGETRGIGLYFRRWEAGLLFIVCDSVPCRKEDAPTIREFVAVAHRKYGLTLEGGMW